MNIDNGRYWNVTTVVSVIYSIGFAAYMSWGYHYRDLQEALYPLLGHVLSHNAVNHITLKIQQQVDIKRLAPLPMTPQIILVDGVWVDILYPTEQTKIDRAGHERQCRQAEERVILAAMAVWADGSYSILHYQIAKAETEQAWSDFFDNLIAKGLDVNTVKLVVSDGTTGLPGVIEKSFPMLNSNVVLLIKFVA